MFFKIGSSLLLLFSFTYAIWLDFQNQSTFLHKISQDIETVFLAQNPHFIILEDGSNYIISSRLAKMTSLEDAQKGTLSHDVVFIQQTPERELTVYSDKAVFFWNTKSEENLTQENLREILFLGNVLGESQGSYLKTESMSYNKKNNLLSGKQESHVYSSKSLMTSLKGFEWNLSSEIVLMKGKIHGNSH